MQAVVALLFRPHLFSFTLKKCVCKSFKHSTKQGANSKDTDGATLFKYCPKRTRKKKRADLNKERMNGISLWVNGFSVWAKRAQCNVPIVFLRCGSNFLESPGNHFPGKKGLTRLPPGDSNNLRNPGKRAFNSLKCPCDKKNHFLFSFKF